MPSVSAADTAAADRSQLASVRNAARVLRAFSRAGQELGITELSRQLGVSKSTVHRLVSTLVAERLLERGGTPGRYRLGLVLYELGSNVTEHVDLHQAALPVIATLRHETGEMVHVAVLDGLEVVYVERLESHNLLPIFRQVGHRLPAHTTSSGKILLAALPSDELARRLADWRPRAVTPWTITDRNRLLAELDTIARRGWAQNNEEGHLGIVSVGAPIRGRDGRVMAAVSVVGDSARMRAMMRRATALVVESARVISRRLGYTPPPPPLSSPNEPDLPSSPAPGFRDKRRITPLTTEDCGFAEHLVNPRGPKSPRRPDPRHNACTYLAKATNSLHLAGSPPVQWMPRCPPASR